VRRTGLTSAGRRFAYETYTAELERHDPGFDALQWGGQAHLAPYVDVWQEYHSIAGKIDDGFTASGDYAAEIASLTAKVGPVYARLNERLGRMTEVFDASTGDLRRALRMAR